MKTNEATRRRFLQGVGSLGMLAAMERLVPAYARTGFGEAATQTNIIPQLSGSVIV